MNLDIQYKVTVKTSSIMQAGTDANVFISLNGDKNKILRHQLKTPSNDENPFETNQKDDFVFDNIDIGIVCFISF